MTDDREPLAILHFEVGNDYDQIRARFVGEPEGGAVLRRHVAVKAEAIESIEHSDQWIEIITGERVISLRRNQAITANGWVSHFLDLTSKWGRDGR